MDGIAVAFIVLAGVSLMINIMLIRFSNPLKLIDGFLKQRYQDESAYFKVLNESISVVKGEEPIVFIGDSLTEECRFGEYFPGRLILNRGISGDTTEGVYGRIEVNACNANPLKVFLLIGTNDVEKKIPMEVIIGNFERIIKIIKAQSPDARIYLQSLYPVCEKEIRRGGRKMVGRRTNLVLDKLNDKIEKLAMIKGIQYIDINTSLKDKNGELNSGYTLEGLHLNGAGYAIVTEGLKRYIDE